MSRMPEYGIPDEEMPEATERDFALARRRDGRPVDPVASGRQRLLDAISDLENMRDDESVGRALKSIEDAVKQLATADH